MDKQKIIILDRDGTLIENIDYLNDKSKIKFLPNCIKTLKYLSESNYLLFIVTNQSGIGRGLISKNQYEEVTNELKKKLIFNNINIVDVKYCPHTPEANCHCRKPNVALGLEILAEYDVDLSRSFVIGDSISDIDFGKNLNLNSILINNTNSSIGVSFLSCKSWTEINHFFRVLSLKY